MTMALNSDAKWLKDETSPQRLGQNPRCVPDLPSPRLLWNDNTYIYIHII